MQQCHIELRRKILIFSSVDLASQRSCLTSGEESPTMRTMAVLQLYKILQWKDATSLGAGQCILWAAAEPGHPSCAADLGSRQSPLHHCLCC